ncbi:Uncharacterised protein [uncultured Clostridium sp.]|nr:Uncharacterised protein [uncultured Clostridium sp.]
MSIRVFRISDHYVVFFETISKIEKRLRDAFQKLKNVFKTYFRNRKNVFKMHFRNRKTSSRRISEIEKTSSRCISEIEKRLQDAFQKLIPFFGYSLRILYQCPLLFQNLLNVFYLCRSLQGMTCGGNSGGVSGCKAGSHDADCRKCCFIGRNHTTCTV